MQICHSLTCKQIDLLKNLDITHVLIGQTPMGYLPETHRKLLLLTTDWFTGLEITPVRSSGTSRFSPRASNFCLLTCPTGKSPGKPFADETFDDDFEKKG